MNITEELDNDNLNKKTKHELILLIGAIPPSYDLFDHKLIKPYHRYRENASPQWDGLEKLSESELNEIYHLLSRQYNAGFIESEEHNIVKREYKSIKEMFEPLTESFNNLNSVILNVTGMTLYEFIKSFDSKKEYESMCMVK